MDPTAALLARYRWNSLLMITTNITFLSNGGLSDSIIGCTRPVRYPLYQY